jgi:YspA, cpYpsA-related SLOG family
MTGMTTILVSGDRRWTHPDRLAQVLDQTAAEAGGPVRLLVGDCPTGADRHALWWARQRGVAFQVFWARWKQMAAEGRPRRAPGRCATWPCWTPSTRPTAPAWWSPCTTTCPAPTAPASSYGPPAAAVMR